MIKLKISTVKKEIKKVVENSKKKIYDLKHNQKSFKEQDPTKKKVCRFCGTNEYEDKYAKHLNSKHKDIMNNRIFLKNITKHLSAEQLEAVRKFILEIKSNGK